MAIEQGLCASFVLELHQAIHDFTEDTLKMALYGADAELSPDTTEYTATGEVTGDGYTAGGAALTFEEDTPKLIGRILAISFADLAWETATFTVRGALIYNSSKANRAVAVLNFGGSISVSATTFTVPSPTVDANSALIRGIA